MNKMGKIQKVLGTKCKCGHIFNERDYTVDIALHKEKAFRYYFKCSECAKEIVIGVE